MINYQVFLFLRLTVHIFIISIYLSLISANVIGHDCDIVQEQRLLNVYTTLNSVSLTPSSIQRTYMTH